MKYIIDIIIALILVLSVYLGYKRGFVKTVFSCLSVVFAIVAAYFFGSYVGEFLRTTPIYETMGEGVEKRINEHLDEMLEDGLLRAEDMELYLSKTPIGESLKRFGFDDGLYGSLRNALENGADNVKTALADELCEKVMLFLSDALGALIVFVAALIVLKLLCTLIDGVVKLPLLNSINKAAGIIAGLLLGVVSVFILCTMLEILAPCIPENPVIYPGMERNTILYGLFLSLNPLILLLFA